MNPNLPSSGTAKDSADNAASAKDGDPNQQQTRQEPTVYEFDYSNSGSAIESTNSKLPDDEERDDKGVAAQSRVVKPEHRSRLRLPGLPLLLAAGLLLLILVLAGIAMSKWLGVLDQQIVARLQQSAWDIPAKVYARPMELYSGQALGPQRLIAELEKLGYNPALAESPGTYSVVQGPDGSAKVIEIYVRNFHFADEHRPATRVGIEFDGSTIADLSNLDEPASLLTSLRLEPLLIGSLHSALYEDREQVNLDDLPEGFVETLLAVEDKRFLSHAGVSLRGLLRAVVANLKSGRKAQGGSTLTQQLVKNLFLSPEKTYSRKFREMGLALAIERRYDKETILELFINEVFLAQQGNRAIHGFALASRFFYDKPVAELERHQYALLIGMIKAPSAYNPERNSERAKRRRNTVLQVLVNDGILDQQAADELMAKPVVTAFASSGDSETDRVPGKSRQANSGNPAYLDLVRQQLVRDFSSEQLQSDGLRIFTSFDADIQAHAERSLADFLDTFRRDYPDYPSESIQAAVVVSDSNTGEVNALIGSRNHRPGGFNRALDARRPIGSLVKPAVYLTALQSGQYTLGSQLNDESIELELPNGDVWAPNNFDGQSRGPIPLIDALAKSLNLAAVNLMLELGMDRLIDTLRQLGVTADIPAVPAIVLGALELTPLEVNRLYQTFASGGFVQPLRTIRNVVNTDGDLLSQYPLEMSQAFSSEAMYLLQYAMTDVMLRGTGRSVGQSLPRNHFVAGKTGTTDDRRDSWFSGFTGDYLATVWLGSDQNQPTPLTGSSGALRVWSGLMSNVSQRPLQFGSHDNINYIAIDPDSGNRTSRRCKSAYLLPYIKGTEPEQRVNCGKNSLGQRLSRWLEELVDPD